MEENVPKGDQKVESSVYTYTYDAANQLLKVVKTVQTYNVKNGKINVLGSQGENTVFGHDANGNMIGEVKLKANGTLIDNKTYVYDFDDCLVKVEIRKTQGTALCFATYTPFLLVES
jgi:hypothetical protein